MTGGFITCRLQGLSTSFNAGGDLQYSNTCKLQMSSGGGRGGVMCLDHFDPTNQHENIVVAEDFSSHSYVIVLIAHGLLHGAVTWRLQT